MVWQTPIHPSFLFKQKIINDDHVTGRIILIMDISIVVQATNKKNVHVEIIWSVNSIYHSQKQFVVFKSKCNQSATWIHNMVQLLCYKRWNSKKKMEWNGNVRKETTTPHLISAQVKFNILWDETIQWTIWLQSQIVPSSWW